jgi:hypothetical protein
VFKSSYDQWQRPRNLSRSQTSLTFCVYAETLRDVRDHLGVEERFIASLFRMTLGGHARSRSHVIAERLQIVMERFDLMPADFTLDDYLDTVCLFFFPNAVKDHLARAFQQISIADDVVGSQVLQAWRASSEYALKLHFILRETEQIYARRLGTLWSTWSSSKADGTI